MKRRMSTGLGLGLALCMVLAGVVWANNTSLTLVSRAGITAYGPLDHYAAPQAADWGTSNSAVATWFHPSWPSIPGATWVSTAYYVEAPYWANSWRWFHDEFELCAGAYNIQAGLGVAATADNAEELYFNGVVVGSDGEVEGPFVDDHEWNTIIDYPITPVPGMNTLDFIVRNYSGNDSPTDNPTGLLYRVELTYDCPIQVTIDIKPGSDPNCFNNDGHGVIPVAILGSETLDAAQIDPSTVHLEGLVVRMVGKSDKLLAHLEDVNGDGFVDLVVQIEDTDGVWTAGTSLANVTGNLYDGTPIVGQDYVCITQ
jgi:hypothetical protein